MDASALPQDAVKVLNLYMIDGTKFPSAVPQRNPVIKYTKLPDFDFDSRVLWPTPTSYTLQPRLRRIIALDDETLPSPKSPKSKSSSGFKARDIYRKITKITEDEEYDQKYKSQDLVRAPSKSLILDINSDLDDLCTVSPRCRTAKKTKEEVYSVNAMNKSLDIHGRLKQPIVVPRSTMTKEEVYSINAMNKSLEMNGSLKQPIVVPRSTMTKEEVYSVNAMNQSLDMNGSLKQPIVIPRSTMHTKETKSSAKTNIAYRHKKEPNVAQTAYKLNRATNKSPERQKLRQPRERDHRSPKTGQSRKISSTKNLNVSNDNEGGFQKTDNVHHKKSTRQKSSDKTSPHRVPFSNPPSHRIPSSNPPSSRMPSSNPQSNRIPFSYNRYSIKDYDGVDSPRPVKKRGTIHKISKSSLRKDRSKSPPSNRNVLNNYCYTDDIIMLKHVNVGTEHNRSVDRVTDMDDFNVENCKCDNSVQTELIKDIFDSLEIPNVTLTKDKSEVIQETVKSCSALLPNVKLAPFHKPPFKDDINMCASASYVYSSATLTYTTRKKINFHVVDSDEVKTNIVSSPLNYPLNVVSVFKRELEKNIEKVANDAATDTTSLQNKDSPEDYLNRISERSTLDCSYIFNKVMKPTDIISSIRVNNGQLQNDYICEQFQRELNFIDSFLASLQYLENCSLSAKCISESKVDCFLKKSVIFDPSFDVKNSECDNFLSKLENGEIIEDSETIASKSLCLLNLLIRDEQRRAKNLLFVLKMREDALKDFTKSQILWLEKKKKQDNTDISTLKKKQRGALLKLQHECGEMQRMRKALITLSEKRKVALMKTKKNIELKLDNKVDVEHIILEKKKLKRIASADRNASPLKCFDLSSSGCEESASKPNMDLASVPPTAVECIAVSNEEKCDPVASSERCIQTGDVLSNLIIPKELDSEVTDVNLVAVDGGYLNIIFNDLALPQIFSSGKQYEVNEKELQNILSTTRNSVNDNELIEKLIDRIVMNKDSDCSTPSTARSLVDEFDQYYKGLTDVEKNITAPISDIELNDTMNVSDGQLSEGLLAVNSMAIMSISDKSSSNCELVMSDTNQSVVSEESGCLPSLQITGPLPVPVGATAVADSPSTDVAVPLSLQPVSSTTYDNENDSSIRSLNSDDVSITTPVQSEAEELRRQQLAIEREIKALEQQQCRMLVVREIPDKPPPPYTPPNETKPKPPRMFVVDVTTELKIASYVKEMYNSSTTTDSSINVPVSQNKDEAFDIFLKDFCKESVECHKQEDSDKPWDALNLLPQKRQSDYSTVLRKTSANILDVLSNSTVGIVSVVSGRRSDHVDDILFNEWRRCEPEWTTLHTDEAVVKNQLFEIIFQKVLSETVEEYKKIVQSPAAPRNLL